VNVISYSSLGQFLVAGDLLSLYTIHLPDPDKEPEMSLYWTSALLPKRIQMAEFSPDGTLFATCSKDDCNVKIWLKTLSKSFDFIYLSHPRPILNFSWKKSNTQFDNVLMTNCIDAVSRIWHSVNHKDNFPHRFHVACFITLRPTIPLDESRPFVCHWLHSVDIALSYLHRNLTLENLKGFFNYS
jgi:WD40 repeat protein